ncbi:unnamed protein product [Pleuronectes platessa]|uniref:Uncharacterized protein n=1 Tax=Pleuronectes platessa TaxID=8262 RepID=A0A9N7VV66_PLEPL|nr:unnamed protein product [Pleuronectes platessa]
MINPASPASSPLVSSTRPSLTPPTCVRPFNSSLPYSLRLLCPSVWWCAPPTSPPKGPSQAVNAGSSADQYPPATRDQASCCASRVRACDQPWVSWVARTARTGPSQPLIGSHSTESEYASLFSPGQIVTAPCFLYPSINCPYASNMFLTSRTSTCLPPYRSPDGAGCHSAQERVNGYQTAADAHWIGWSRHEPMDERPAKIIIA